MKSEILHFLLFTFYRFYFDRIRNYRDKLKCVWAVIHSQVNSKQTAVHHKTKLFRL